MLDRPFAFIVVLSCAACVGVGPGSIQAQRSSYTEVLGATDAEELLANIVRLRYLDTPVFLRVSSVTASPTLELSSGLNASLDSDGDFGGAGSSGGVVYTDQPTIVYEPLDGREFANELLVPLDAAPVFLMVANGFDFDVVARLLFASIEGLTNERSASAEARRPFRETTRDLAQLMREGLVRLGTPEGGLDAAKPGLVLRVDERAYAHPAGQRAFEVLGVESGLDVVDVRFGLASDGRSIAVRTRSLLAVLSYLSDCIDVDPADESLVWPSTQEEEPLLHVNSAGTRPANGQPAVRIRGRWFYLRADDLRSRNTFYLLRLLFSLQARTAESGDGVVLTLPVR